MPLEEVTVVRQFVDDLIGAGATVYGAAVRDLALASHAGRAFRLAGGRDEDFDDPGVLPAFAARTTGPRRVDAVIGVDDYADIEWERFGVRAVSKTNVANPSDGWPNNASRFRFVFSYVRDDLFDAEQMLNGMHPAVRGAYADVVRRFAHEMTVRMPEARRRFSLDLVVIRDANANEGVRPAYDVDGLLLDCRGMWVCDALTRGMNAMQRHVVFEAVLAAVVARIATPCQANDSHSNLQMQEDGWKIQPFEV